MNWSKQERIMANFLRKTLKKQLYPDENLRVENGGSLRSSQSTPVSRASSFTGGDGGKKERGRRAAVAGSGDATPLRANNNQLPPPAPTGRARRSVSLLDAGKPPLSPRTSPTQPPPLITVCDMSDQDNSSTGSGFISFVANAAHGSSPVPGNKPVILIENYEDAVYNQRTAAIKKTRFTRLPSLNQVYHLTHYTS